MQKALFFIVLLSSFYPCYAQYEPTKEEVLRMIEKESEQKLVVQCAVLMEEGYLYFAEIIADKLLTIRPDSPNYNFRKGYLLYERTKNTQEARVHLEIALQKISNDYDPYTVKEKGAPVDTYFSLAKCYHLDGQMDKAINFYKQFLNTVKPGDDMIPLAQVRIEQCMVAKREMSNPKGSKVENMGSRINSEYADFSPVVSLDGSALYFTSRRPWDENQTESFRDKRLNHYPEDIYVSYQDFDGEWMLPTKVDFCLPAPNEATTAVSPDERRIYIYEDITGNGDIYYSDFSTNKFQEIKKLEGEGINTTNWEPHLMVTFDGQYLYFVSDRPGGYGGRDIYRCTKLPNGQWSLPINLGPNINTPYDEDSPFMSVDNKTLYFSSNGPLSMGDFDVFVSRKDDNNNWSTPINLGYPINSTGSDLYYTTTVDGLRGFLTSYRPGGAGEKDIYEIKNDYVGITSVSVLKGQIRTVNNKDIPEDVAIRVTCTSCFTKEVQTVFPRLRDGIYFASLEPCNDYELVYSYDGGKKEIYKELVSTSCEQKYDEIYRDILINVDDVTNIQPIEKKPGENTIILPNPPNKKDWNEDKDSTKARPIHTIEVPAVVAAEFRNPRFKQYFKYNVNKINPKRGEFGVFIKSLEKQLIEGRETLSIVIYSSASKVPTKTYGSNEELARMRAENLKYDIMAYFQKNSKYADRIVVSIGESLVQGPDYQNDAKNQAKYGKFQYVMVNIE